MPSMHQYRVKDCEGSVHLVSLGKKETGQRCLDQVCGLLQLLEKEYFSLQYTGKHGERLWVNLRNPLHEQLPQGVSTLDLRVKFFVKPQRLMQLLSKRYFFLQLRSSLLKDRETVFQDDQIDLAALALQADLGDCRQTGSDLSRCAPHLLHLQHSTQSAVLDRYRELRGLEAAVAVDQFLGKAQRQESYGIECHPVVDSKGRPWTVAVGPSSIVVTNEFTHAHTRHSYSEIQCTAHHGKKFQIVISGQHRGASSRYSFRLQSKAASLALYRAITEFHTFFCRETVGLSVRSAGYQTSFFSALKKSPRTDRYYFDVLKTHKEVIQHVLPALQESPEPEETEELRQSALLWVPSHPSPSQGVTCAEAVTDLDLHSSHEQRAICRPLSSSHSCLGFHSTGPPAGPPPEYSERDPLLAPFIPSSTCLDPSAVLSRAQQLEEELCKIKNLMTCRVCRESPVGATFCPCGHTVCCVACAAQYQHCIQCSSQVENVQRVLLA